MKIGVISDIHGNLHAFKPIYERLKKEKYDINFFLGDICGYYFQQNEVIGMLKEIPRLESIAGNHDALFLESLENEPVMKSYTERFGLSFEILKESITPENLDFLKRLPRQFDLKSEGIACFHGSPWSPTEEYVYPDSPMERFDHLPYKAVFLGHTHRPMNIRREYTRIINPGSVGQPRDGGWPSYAVYDTQTGELEIKRVRFDVDASIDDVKQRKDPNAYLIDVLKRIKQNTDL